MADNQETIKKTPLAGGIQPLEQAQETQSSGFGYIAQDKSVNDFFGIAVSKNRVRNGTAKTNREDGITTVTVYNNNVEAVFTYKQKEGIDLCLDTLTKLFFHFIGSLFTQGNKQQSNIFFTVDDYMEARGLKDRKEARKQIDRCLDTLGKCNISVYYKTKKGRKFKGFVAIIDTSIWTDKQRTVKQVTLGKGFCALLTYGSIMPFSLDELKTNPHKNPHSAYFLYKINTHKNMNYGKPNENIISVKTLMEASPYMPRYEEERERGRHYDRKLIEPFERDMNALESTLTWEYCHDHGKPLTEQEIENQTYEKLVKLNILIHWKNYPARTEKKAIPSKKRGRIDSKIV